MRSGRQRFSLERACLDGEILLLQSVMSEWLGPLTFFGLSVTHLCRRDAQQIACEDPEAQGWWFGDLKRLRVLNILHAEFRS